MAEYMRDEFPDIDAYNAITDPAILERIVRIAPNPNQFKDWFQPS